MPSHIKKQATTPPSLKGDGKKAQEKAGATAASPVEGAESGEPADSPETVERTPEQEQEFQAELAKERRVRKMRKRGLAAASVVLGSVNALASIPKGIQLGLDTVKGTSEEKKVLNEARISTLTAVSSSSLAGLTVAGPVGLVVGGVVGYVAGTLGNHLASRSGTGGADRKHISEAVEKSVGESKGLWGKTKAIYRGAVEGAKRGYQTRATTSKIQLSGMLDGVEAAIQQVSESKGTEHPEFSPDSKHGLFKQAMLLAGGVLGGVAGVAINAPGGMVTGVLESLKETKSYVPSDMEKSLMLWATNVGKFLPAAAVSATLGGAVGIAASTAVGVTTASLASIIDGRLGVNRKIAGPVQRAVKEAHGEEDVKENLRAYYRAGKGAVVGLAAGIHEGWKAGFKGGMEIVDGTVASIPEAVDKEEKKEAG